MFSGICAALAAQAGRRCLGDFLKEKGQITRLSKDATPKTFFFYTKTSSVFILIFYFFHPKTESRSQWFSVSLMIILLKL